MKKAYIFSGGADFHPEFVTDIPQEDDLVIAADSGAEKLEFFDGVLPDIILGDMDSCDFESIKRKYGDAEFIILPCEKDSTDTKYALDLAIKRGFTDIVVIGGLGGRLDHTLSNVFLLEYAASKGAVCVLTNGKNRAFLLDGECNLCADAYKYLSLIPLDAELLDVNMSGVKYPLAHARVVSGDSLTISNEIVCENSKISVSHGRAIVVQSID